MHLVSCKPCYFLLSYRKGHLQQAFNLHWSSQKCLRTDGRLLITTQETCSSSRCFSLGFHQVLIVRLKFDSAGLWTGYLQKNPNPSVMLLYTHYMSRIDGDGWRSWDKSKMQKWMMDKENMKQQGKMQEGKGESRRTVLPWAPESAFARRGKPTPCW